MHFVVECTLFSIDDAIKITFPGLQRLFHFKVHVPVPWKIQSHVLVPHSSWWKIQSRD